MGAYLGLIWLLWAMLVSSFDRLAGRAVARPLIYAEDPPETAPARPTATTDSLLASEPVLDGAGLPTAANEPRTELWKTE
jgi:hypothetical protein